jgi:hypothetical protein
LTARPTYSPPIGFASFSLNLSVPANTDSKLPWTWNEVAGEDDLLDTTDPLNPTIITAGIYAITGDITCADGQQAGQSARLSVGIGNFANICALDIGLPDVDDPASNFPDIVRYAAAGAVVIARVRHSKVSALNFTSGIGVQRIT